MVPSSLNTQFDEILETMVKNTVSLETMSYAKGHIKLSKGYLECSGNGVPSLLDSGSMVTLIREGYFEKKILPLRKYRCL